MPYRLNIDMSIVELIREEISNININQMLDRSIETTDKGTLIRDINGWHYSYTIFQDLYDLNIESFEQANTDYIFFKEFPRMKEQHIKLVTYLILFQKIIYY